MGSKALVQTAQHLEVFKKTWIYGAWGPGVKVNVLVVHGWQLDLMIQKIFSNLNDSLIPSFLFSCSLVNFQLWSTS